VRLPETLSPRAAWLISGFAAAAHCSGVAAASLSPAVYANRAKPRGHFIMIRTRARAVAVLTETLQDFLLIASFGFWAVLLGFFPVLAYHNLIGH
jgi:hypothetical protein